MTFSHINFDPNISKAISACGYTTLTPIQEKSIPVTLSGKDLVASAETGSGKTAAFVLPALQRLSEQKPGIKPRVLILTPTRELAAQITQAANKYGKFLKFNIVSLVGGMPYRQQLKSLSQAVDIIVATPGRLLDHMEKQKQRLDLSQIEMLILDEADRMLDMGFIDDVKQIAKATPSTRQTLLFSATVDDKLGNIIRQLLNDPVRINLSNQQLAPSQITQKVYYADHTQHKNRLLQHLLAEENIFKAIIFSATKLNADKLAKQLRDAGLEAAALHGDLKQNVRNRTVEQLRRGKIQFLVATDVAARGIDISDVSHVINYDLPKFSEDYVHRIGRTGRAGKEGAAISFVLPSDKLHLGRIERYTGQRLELAVIAGLEPTQNFNAAPAGKKSKGGGGKRKRSSNDSQPKKYFGGQKKESQTSWKKKPEGNGDRAEFRGRPEGAGRSESRGRAEGAGRPEFRGRSEGTGRSEFRGRSESAGRPEFRGRGEGAGRSEFRGRSEGTGRSEFRGRSESAGRPEFRGRGEGAGRPEFRGRSEGTGRSEFRGRSESAGRPEFRGRGEGAGRSEFRGRSEGTGRSEFRGRSESAGRPEFRGRGEGAGRSEFRGRSEGTARPEFRGRSEGAGRPEFRGKSEGNKRPEFRGEKRRDTKVEGFRAAKAKPFTGGGRSSERAQKRNAY